MAIKKLVPETTDSRKSITMKSDPTRIDSMKLKLGKQAARHDPRTLLLATYTTPALPAPPPSLDLTDKVKGAWGMMDNDQIGDCTCAAAGHLLMEWTSRAKPQTENHQPWSVPPQGPIGDGAPRSWGGQAVSVMAYDARGVTVITWGAPQFMTWGFWNTYCDEAYAIISPDFLEKKAGQLATPDGFNLQQLQADLADLK